MIEKFRDDFKQREPEEAEPSAARQALKAISRNDWAELSKLLISKKSRSCLHSLTGVLLSSAYINGTSRKFLDCLPKRLTAEEGQSAFAYICDIKSLDLAIGIFEKEGRPSRKAFFNICEDYISRDETPFEFEIIRLCLKLKDYDWRRALHFHDQADYYDVLMFSKKSCKPAYIMISYQIMPSRVKAKTISRIQSVEQFYLLLKHSSISEVMLKHVSLDLRSKLLTYELGL